MDGFAQFNSMSHIIKYFCGVSLLVILSLFACKEDAAEVDIHIEKGIEYIEKRGDKFEASTGLFMRFLAEKFVSADIPTTKDLYGSMGIFEQQTSTKLYQRLMRSHSISKQDIEQYSESTSINDLQYKIIFSKK